MYVLVKYHFIALAIFLIFSKCYIIVMQLFVVLLFCFFIIFLYINFRMYTLNYEEKIL